MELRLQPSENSAQTQAGFVIRGESVQHWLTELERMAFTLSKVTVYALPDTTANSIFGCLVLPSSSEDLEKNDRHLRVQEFVGLLYHPLRTEVLPQLEEQELLHLFKSKPYAFLPDIGLFELEAPVNWSEIIEPPVSSNCIVTVPTRGYTPPKEIKQMFLKEIPAKEVEERMEKELFPEKETIEEKPLSFLEKAQMRMLKWMLAKKAKEKGDDTTDAEGAAIGKDGKDGGAGLGAGLGGLILGTALGIGALVAMPLNALFKAGKKGDGSVGAGAAMGASGAGQSSNGLFDKWIDSLGQKLDGLVDRNKKALDKLFDMMKNDPNEALKYAIPIDSDGVTRGNQQAGFDMSRRWSNFSLFQGYGSGAGGSVDFGDRSHELYQRYTQMAEDFIKKGNYHKAAFVYLKLLNNKWLAASTLRDGGYYEEAATIYLEKLKDKNLAAHCYRKGKFYEKSIELYLELEEHETAGDICVEMGQRGRGDYHYATAETKLCERADYITASKLCRAKRQIPERAQEILLQGWRYNARAYDCANAYFKYLPEEVERAEEMYRFYEKEVSGDQQENFLNVVTLQYENEPDERMRDLAYEIISLELDKGNNMSGKLFSYNKGDKQISRDVSRFRYKRY
jgi:tetratricopeptide (TPR) repeat protein